MEDRFKFRAWHIEDGVMVYFDKEDQYQLLHMFRLMQGNHDEPGIIEQCIGRKDKNGTLIYEGDIFEFALYGKVNDLCQVVFCQKDIQFKFRVLKYGNEYSFDLIQDFKYVEIIGNIHDNPELLEDGI